MHQQQQEELNELLNREHLNNSAINGIIGDSASVQTIVSPTLLHDLELREWASKNTHLIGGTEMLWNKLTNPRNDIPIQIPSVANTLPVDTDVVLKRAADAEKSALWLFTNLPEIKEAWPMAMLFPSWPVFNRLNYIPLYIKFFHTYRGYIAPWMHILSPTVSLLGPYFYIRRTLKWKITLSAYLNFIIKGLRQYLQPTPGMTVREIIYKYGFIAAYIGVFIYGILQSIEIAKMLRSVRAELIKKRKDVQIILDCARVFGIDLNIPSGLAGIYTLWTDPVSRDKFRQVMHGLYSMDCLATVRRLLLTKTYCIPQKAVNQETKIWNIGHPGLPITQIRNPVSLADNLIITGPNAAGKTTYMKSIAINQVLAQSLGICCARKAIVKPVEVIGSFIRVNDSVGKRSLFEAEVERCHELLDSAKNNASALYFIDEPMNSCPPLEGAAMAIAFVKKLGDMPGITVITTTHYHQMCKILDIPGFKNVSMSAIQKEDGFEFPYKLQAGPSYQCIAIELLKEPADMIESAIKIKKDLCIRQEE